MLLCVRCCPRSRGKCTKVATLSTESIASSLRSVGAAESCAGCGSPLAADQRYCLECGERRTARSSVLAGGPPARSDAQPSSAAAPASGTGASTADGAGQRNNTVTVIAGVGVLLLAMGVGVLIGRAGASKPAPTSAQVITVAAPGAAASTGAAAAPASFTDDWPAGTSGYTVQLQTLPQSTTQPSAVEAAKASATAKGAKSVGALKSEDFASLTAGSYVVYSGIYHSKAEAEKALPGLKKSFAGASVIHVSNHSSSAGGSRVVLHQLGRRIEREPPCASDGSTEPAQRKRTELRAEVQEPPQRDLHRLVFGIIR